MKLAIAALIALLTGPAVAQQHQHEHSPCAGSQQRAVKALGDQQISDLCAGRGMGLALAAELNGYPGPVHVLELGDRLELTQEQKEQARQLYEAMKAEAVVVGEKLLAGNRPSMAS
jgi:parvulin-like peptidyl-prolyl isomerase